MKVSLNWARFYGNINLSAVPTETLVQKIGEQLGAVEEVVLWGPRYDGIVVVRVVRCEKHPDADTLHVCFVDDGGVTPEVARDKDGYVQVVCGAPNVQAGMTAAWLPPGTFVPSTLDKDPFKLEARAIRGITSNGMLASPAELGISDNHDGLLVIEAKDVGEERLKPGTPFKRLYGLDDVVIDMENKMFTHRPDCFGILGVTRELAGITGQAFTSPDWYVGAPQFETTDSSPLNVINDIPTLVPRFMTVVMDGVKIDSSPVWVQAALTRVGIKPINNVVDITNFAMHLTGQPLHAFDFDKIIANSQQASLGPRLALDGEELTLLGGKKVQLTSDDIVIATDSQAVALAGIMGGADTEVDSSTTRIIIECANFDMFTIRRSSMRHGLFTDAAQRFTKGQSPVQTDRVLAYTMKLLNDYAGASVVSRVYDERADDVLASNEKSQHDLRVGVDFVNARLGSEITPEGMATLLQNVEIATSVEEGNTLLLKIPFWRQDIRLAEDVVEEIGRLYGYHQIPVVLPRRPAKSAPLDAIREIKMQMRERLSAAGANEILSYSFVHGDLLKKVGQDSAQAYQLRNALSPDLQYYRTSLLPSLMTNVYQNLRAGFSEFVLFELNPEFSKLSVDDDGLPIEYSRLALVFAADRKATKQSAGAAYYRAKHYLEFLLGAYGVNLQYKSLKDVDLSSSENNQITQAAPMLQADRSAVAYIDSVPLGLVGEPAPSVRKSLKLPEQCAVFDIDIGLVLEKQQSVKKYRPLARFPAIDRDICFRVSVTTSFAEVVVALDQTLSEHMEKQQALHVHIQPVDIFQAADKEAFKQITLRVTLRHEQHTLTDEAVNKIIESAAHAAAQKLDGTIV